MSQMSKLRQWLGGYKLVAIDNFQDISYMPEGVNRGIPTSYWYYQSRSGKTVRKIVDGHWKLHEQSNEKEGESHD